MDIPAISDLKRFARARHSLPKFDGRASRRHENIALRHLGLLAAADYLKDRHRFDDVHTFVQFAGFPRSGHSLIGSILDAHANARVSHELDATGLKAKGMPERAVFSLIDRQAREFTRHGRYWNGLNYMVPNGHHSAVNPLRVIGDKKGDAAVRWIAEDPALLAKAASDTRIRRKWILVLRNPFDNIATMSLRKGRAYDALRTREADTGKFAIKLQQWQASGEIVSEALNSEIDEYEALCHTVERIKQNTATEDWFELQHEAIAERPERGIRSLLHFLDLSQDEAFTAGAASLVRPSPNRTRDQLAWPQDKTDRVHALIERFSFLHGYR